MKQKEPTFFMSIIFLSSCTLKTPMTYSIFNIQYCSNTGINNSITTL